MLERLKRFFGIETVSNKPPFNPPTLEMNVELPKGTNAERPSNPAYKEAKKHTGAKETDPKFNKYLSGFWAKVGLKHYKTIIGTSFAWCGLMIFAMNTEVGQKYVDRAASAKSADGYGDTIDWKVNGLPVGAVARINHDGNCKSSSGNHVTFVDGDCTAAELSKPGAMFPGFGGNQQNMVKRSMYSVKEICHVGWPKEVAKPGPVLKSVNCSGSGSGKESTR